MPEIKNYLPLNRKVFNHEFWTEKRVFSKYEAWLDLLREARYDEDIRSEIICNQRVEWGRGELPASLRFLAEKWMWSKGKVDSFLQTLKKLGMIKTRTASGTVQTIITICKYDEYNPAFKNKGQSKDSKRTVEGQSKDKSKEDNKVNISIGILNFENAFNSFLEMRIKIKKPATEFAIKLLKTKLEKLAPGDLEKQILLIEQSILNSWQDIFPLKENFIKTKNGKNVIDESGNSNLFGV